MTSNTDGAAQGDWIADYGEEGYIITDGIETFGVNHNYGRPDRLVAILRADHRKAQTAGMLAKALEALRALHDGVKPYRNSASEVLRMADAALAQFHAATEEATRP